MSDFTYSEQMEADWNSLWWGFLSELMQEFGLVGAKKGDLTTDRLESLDKLYVLINLQNAVLELFCGRVIAQNISIIGDFFRKIDSKVALPKFLKELDEFSEKYPKKL